MSGRQRAFPSINFERELQRTAQAKQVKIGINIASVSAKETKMNHFRPNSFFELSRNEIENIAFTAALELKILKQTQAKRENLDLLLCAFAAGVCFTISALLFGISLH